MEIAIHTRAKFPMPFLFIFQNQTKPKNVFDHSRITPLKIVVKYVMNLMIIIMKHRKQFHFIREKCTLNELDTTEKDPVSTLSVLFCFCSFSVCFCSFWCEVFLVCFCKHIYLYTFFITFEWRKTFPTLSCTENVQLKTGWLVRFREKLRNFLIKIQTNAKRFPLMTSQKKGINLLYEMLYLSADHSKMSRLNHVITLIID